MNHTNKLLDKYREVCGFRTDMAAAAALGVGRATVSAWRHEARHAEPESVETMAKAVGLDPEEWVLRVQADREGQVNPKRAQVWLRCVERISGSAAAMAMTIGLAVYTPQAHSQPLNGFSQNDPALYIMSNHVDAFALRWLASYARHSLSPRR